MYQRKQYKLKQSGKPTTLTTEKESLLNELEFCWESPQQNKKRKNIEVSSATGPKNRDKEKKVKKHSSPSEMQNRYTRTDDLPSSNIGRVTYQQSSIGPMAWSAPSMFYGSMRVPPNIGPFNNQQHHLNYMSNSLDSGAYNNAPYQYNEYAYQGIPSARNKPFSTQSPTQHPTSTLWMCEKCRVAYFPSMELALKHEMSCLAVVPVHRNGAANLRSNMRH